MDEIHVQLLPPTERGRLYPQYHNAIKILNARSPIERKWPYGINIDGLLILDIDSDRILANFELLLPMSKWKSAKLPAIPQASRRADLQIGLDSIAHKYFDLPIVVEGYDSKAYATIAFGEGEGKPEWIALSKQCLAQVDGDRLLGFFVDLTSD